MDVNQDLKNKKKKKKRTERSCVKVEVAVLGSPSRIVLMICVDVKQQKKKMKKKKTQKAEFRSCVKVEVDVLLLFCVRVCVRVFVSNITSM